MSTDETIQRLRAQVTDFTAALDVPPFVNQINDLVNRQMYEQAAAKEQASIALIADMWALIRELAEGSVTSSFPYTYNDMSGKMECASCGNAYSAGSQEADEQDQQHGEACLVSRARKLVAQMKRQM